VSQNTPVSPIIEVGFIFTLFFMLYRSSSEFQKDNLVSYFKTSISLTIHTKKCLLVSLWRLEQLCVQLGRHNVDVKWSLLQMFQQQDCPMW
jgi:hypothetical protein